MDDSSPFAAFADDLAEPSRLEEKAKRLEEQRLVNAEANRPANYRPLQESRLWFAQELESDEEQAVRRASWAYSQGDFHEAIVCFRRALRARPRSLELLDGLGRAQAAAGDLAAARETAGRLESAAVSADHQAAAWLLFKTVAKADDVSGQLRHLLLLLHRADADPCLWWELQSALVGQTEVICDTCIRRVRVSAAARAAVLLEITQGTEAGFSKEANDRLRASVRDCLLTDRAWSEKVRRCD